MLCKVGCSIVYCRLCFCVNILEEQIVSLALEVLCLDKKTFYRLVSTCI